MQILEIFRLGTWGFLDDPRVSGTDIFTYSWVLRRIIWILVSWLRGRSLEPIKNYLMNDGKNANHHYIIKFYIWVEIQISHKNLKICVCEMSTNKRKSQETANTSLTWLEKESEHIYLFITDSNYSHFFLYFFRANLIVPAVWQFYYFKCLISLKHLLLWLLNHWANWFFRSIFLLQKGRSHTQVSGNVYSLKAVHLLLLIVGKVALQFRSLII